MARNRKPTAAADAAPAAGGAMPDLMSSGWGIVREMVNGSLGAAQDATAWMERAQQSQAEALAAWSQTLEAAAHEADQIQDLQQWMTLSNELIDRQLRVVTQQVGSIAAQLMDAEMQMADRVRNGAVQLSRRMMQVPTTTAGATEADGEAPAAPLAQLAQAQAQWLAMSQRWVEAMKADSSADPS